MPHTNREVQVDISQLTLTSFTGAALVNEILKGVIYQKCQIPYPYSWLKTAVEKRRKKINSSDDRPKKLNFTHENHFRIVSTAYDALDSIMNGITKEFCETTSTIKEIVIVFGSTPNCPKETFTITLPSTVKGHIERNHVGQLNKHLQKVLRDIFLSQTWMDSIDASISCTNTYIYLKKLVDGNKGIPSDAFESCGPLQISPNIKHSKFTLCYGNSSNERSNCCDSLVIFNEDEGQINQVNEKSTSNIEQNIIWYRSKNLVKGFKDCFVNKVSVCELW